jgi:glycosyltransferase involved in cell wall biosynthesis
MELISIIIPVHDHLSELRKALNSIKLQTYKNIEVIIVDDGNDYIVKDKINTKNLDFDVIFLRQDHLGAPRARNKGFDISKGEFVIFWDADLVASEQMLEKMHHVLKIHPEASYVYCDYYYGGKKIKSGKFDEFKLKEQNYIMTSSLMRREDFVYFDESLKRFQDWDLWLTMLEKNKIGINIPEFLFFIIPHRGGISSWLPSFAYKNPWKLLPGFRKKVTDFENARDIILKKHKLLTKSIKNPINNSNNSS